jgi:hypothetical protein
LEIQSDIDVYVTGNRSNHYDFIMVKMLEKFRVIILILLPIMAG